jgi:predicted DNA-binding transcriptional regulator YafY
MNVSASRLLSILMMLQARGKMTAEVLASELEISVRTVYRDVEALGIAGVPIYADRGPGGGFALLDGYRTRLTGLSSDEAEALFMIGLPGPAAALGLGAAAEKAAQKVLASLPSALAGDASRLGDWFHFDAVDWFRSVEATPYLSAVAAAVRTRHVACMTYESWTATRDWTVEPLGIVLKAGKWYLVARCDGQDRIFKVSNITKWQPADATFEHRRGFTLATTWAAHVGRFESEIRRGRATVRATRLGLDRLCELGAHAAAAVAEANPPDAGGWSTVVLPIEDNERAALDLLGIGPEVVVVKPVALRRELHDLAHRVARLASQRLMS